jgi:ATP-dependent Lhr-like helicase
VLLWWRGYVEPASAPASPHPIAAQQLPALCLLEGRVGSNVWRAWWSDLPIFDRHSSGIVDCLVESLHMDSENGMLFIGPKVEEQFSHRNFMDLVSCSLSIPSSLFSRGARTAAASTP